MSEPIVDTLETNQLLLFLCTGNYYRSRFVELLFNHQATRAALSWRAESRGIALDLGVNNRGPISLAALAATARAWDRTRKASAIPAAGTSRGLCPCPAYYCAR